MQRIETLEAKVAALELLAGVAHEEDAVGGDAPSEEVAPPRAASQTPSAAGVAVARDRSVERVPAPSAPPARGFSLKTSEALLKWAGTALVVLAVAFALGLAIDRGWITPLVRVVGSSLVAIGLFVAGQRIRHQRLLFAETLQGAAFVVAYLTALSTLVMDLVSGPVGFAAMVAVTLAALAMAAWLDSPPIAVLGVLGGLATPLLLESGIDEAAVLIWYIPLLAIAGLGVFAWTGWRSVANATALAAWLLLFILVEQSQSSGGSQSTGVAAAAVIVGLLVWLVPIQRSVFARRYDIVTRPSHAMEQALEPLLARTAERLAYAAPIITLILTAAVLDLTRYEFSPIVLAVAGLFGIAAIALTRSGYLELAYVHTTMTALLTGVGVTLALDGDVLVVSLALQAVALTLIGRRLGHRPMDWQAYATLVIALLIVLSRSAERGLAGGPSAAEWLAELIVLAAAAWKVAVETRDGYRTAGALVVHVMTLGWLFTVLDEPWVIVAVAATYIVVRVFGAGGIDVELGSTVNAAVIVLMTVAAAGVHYFEIADYRSSRVVALAAAVGALGVAARYLPSRARIEAPLGFVAGLLWIVVAAGPNDAWITAAWVAVGLGTLALGVRRSSSEAQLAGWLTLGLATAKLLLHDLEATEPLVRIGLFFGIGLAFLGLAYLLPTHVALPGSEEDPERAAGATAASSARPSR